MARKTNPAPDFAPTSSDNIARWPSADGAGAQPVEPQGTTLRDLADALEGVVHAAETLPKPLRAAISSALVVRVQMQAKMALTAVQRALKRQLK